jgi:hypothetical protein
MLVNQKIKQIFQVLDLDSNTIHLGHHLILQAKKRSFAYNFVYDWLQTDSRMQLGLRL